MSNSHELMHGVNGEALQLHAVNKNYVQPNNMYHAPTDLHAVYTNSSY